MNPNQNLSQISEEQRIQQILFYARTFRKHSLILYGKKQISPYDLASNGFVNKNFKDQEKQGSIDQVAIKQIICTCRSTQCSKTLKFNSLQNDKYQNQDDEQEIEQMLTDHQENCTFYKKGFNRLGLSELFGVANIFFNQILQTFKKDQSSIIDKIKIDWSLIEQCILSEKEFIGSFSVLLQCYKWLDNKFCISTKKFNPTILISLFGWNLYSIRQNKSIIMKCHFCSKKVQKQVGQSFDFYHEHNLWCLIRKSQYQIWKAMLKKKYIVDKNQIKITEKTHQFVLPKSKAEIQSKQIREQLFQTVEPTLQKIDQLILESLSIVKKQKQFDSQLEKRFEQKENKQNESIQYLSKFTKLDELSMKCKQIVKNFINSIQSKRN